MFYLFIFILGASIGSFLNVLIDRLPQGKSISGRSYCDHCRHKLSWLDLIPIVSFFWLNRECRYCGKKISWQYPLVEFLTAILFISAFFLITNNKYLITFKGFGYWLLVISYWWIISCLIVIFFSDWKYQIIPDMMQIAFFIFSLLLKSAEVFQSGYGGNQWLYYYIVKLLNCFGSGLVVMLPILFLHLATRGRGMGFGDVKLAFNIGFLLGIKAGFLALYFGFVIGGLTGLALLVSGRKKLKSKIAFGPFLIIGMITMLFWREKIFEIVNKIYGF